MEIHRTHRWRVKVKAVSARQAVKIIEGLDAWALKRRLAKSGIVLYEETKVANVTRTRRRSRP